MPSLRTDLALLRHRRFALLTAARTVSVTGNGFGAVALAFGVLALPGASPTRLSIVQASLALPQLLVLVGGVIADRVPRARLMVIAELLAGLGYAGLAALILLGHAPTVALAVLAALAGLGTALFAPAYAGLLPEVVRADQLHAANGLQRLGVNAGQVLGFGLSGVAVVLIGPGWTLAINAGSFLVSAVLLGSLRVPPVSRPGGNPVRELREGWREFRSRQWLWVIVVQFSLLVGALEAYVGVLGPMAARQWMGGAPAWSAVLVAQMAGNLLGVLVAIRVRPRRPMLVATLATLTFAPPLLILGLHWPLVAILAAVFVSGVGIDIFGVLWSVTLQREVPATVISRVSSWDHFGSLALAPLGLAVAGPIAMVAGVGPTLLGGAALIVVATLAALCAPEVRRLRAPTDAPIAAAPTEDVVRPG